MRRGNLDMAAGCECFVLGEEQKSLEKGKVQMKEIEDILGEEGFRGSFFFVIQTPPHLRELKNCIIKEFSRVF